MGRKKKEYVECVLFTLPAIVLVMITIYIPFVMSGYYSLMEWNGISKKPVFIGLKNFTQMFAGHRILSGALCLPVSIRCFSCSLPMYWQSQLQWRWCRR